MQLAVHACTLAVPTEYGAYPLHDHSHFFNVKPTEIFDIGIVLLKQTGKSAATKLFVYLVV